MKKIFMFGICNDLGASIIYKKPHYKFNDEHGNFICWESHGDGMNLEDKNLFPKDYPVRLVLSRFSEVENG